MITKFLSTLVLILGLPLIGFAEPLVVQSGEHTNFTRLVIPLASTENWTIVQNDADVVVTLDGPESGFEIERVFDLIPRDRIAQLKAGKRTLTLSLACDCTVATFLEAGPYLVLDVAARGVSLVGQPVPIMKKNTDLQTETPEPRQMISVVEPALTQLSVRPPRATSSLNFPQPDLDRTELRAVEKRVLSEMQTRLAEQLGSAATRGVLTPALDRNFSQFPQVLAHKPLEDPAANSDPLPPLGPLDNIRISSSLDLTENSRASTLDVARFSCPVSGSFDVFAWGTTEPFSLQIAAARNGLYLERDRLDHAAAAQLAKSYLYFGFGAEARQILELDPVLAKKHGPLLTMADILDGIKTSSFLPLIRVTDCEPEVVLWTILAQTDFVQEAKPNSPAALLALSKLPLHLRQILAPKLSEKLLANGDKQSAAQALRSLERSPVPLQAAAKLVQAELSLQFGQPESAAAQFEEVAAESSEQSPLALIALVDAKVAADEPIEFETAKLVAAYAQELRQSDLGPDLQRAHVLALVKSGQFDQAFETVDAMENDETHPPTKILRSQLLKELTAKAEDIIFLEHIIGQRDSDISNLSPRGLTDLAARLLNTGFAQQAERTLDHLPQTDMSADQKLLAARIALALGKPDDAQASLSSLKDDEANILRADAMHMVGAHDEAHDLYIQSDQMQPAAETAWLSEDWQGLTAVDTPVFGPTSRMAAYASNRSSDPTGMLARTTAVLEESKSARSTLSELLGADELQILPSN